MNRRALPTRGAGADSRGATRSRTTSSTGGPASPVAALALQRQAGNQAVARLMPRASAPVRVARCGPTNPGCGCSPEEREAAGSAPVQRDDLPGFPAMADQLRFTDRVIRNQSLPTVCPNCHRESPTAPMPPALLDKEATEPRLVDWAKESESILNQPGTVRAVQVDPRGVDSVVDDYGAGLIRRIVSSHEFEGTPGAREKGAETVRRHWGEIRPPVRSSFAGWYQNELLTAVGMTPKYAEPVLDPIRLRAVLNTRHGGRAPLGRMGAEAAPGQTYGAFVIDDIGLGQVWFHLAQRPLWIYQISNGDFIRHDPLVSAVAAQVYDQTRWILELTPFLLKVGAFGLGLSGSIALVITGIVLDELAEEMKADVRGQPGRSPQEILTSAGIALLVDRISHGLFGGKAGPVATGLGKTAGKIERIAERSVPLVKRELAAAERPLVKQAMESGAARKVTDTSLRAQGYSVEVAIESAGESHVFRLNSSGTWCRFSLPICGLDLGRDLQAAARSPASFTQTRLNDVRERMGAITNEGLFLASTYERMRTAGRMDLSILSAEERELLDHLAGGEAKDLTLRQLRDLPATLGLRRDFAGAISEEAELIQRLYREGRPLYEIMRTASPSFAARTRVLALAGGRDTATGVLPRTGALHVDHVVPLNEIVSWDAFKKLRPERQLEVVNDLKNLRAVDAAANASRGDRSWRSWPQGIIHYDAPTLARMGVLEDETRTYLQNRIATLLSP